MIELRTHMLETLNLPLDNPPNSCNINWYKDGSAGIGTHSDDEDLFGGLDHPIKIISVSFGAERKFQIYKYEDPSRHGLVTELVLPNNSYMTMEGMFQKHYKHRIPIYPDSDLPPRLNITWR